MKQTKRDQIVRSALNVFYKNGFHTTGMDMLVAETGISKTSMYKYFRTKEDLILAVLRLRDENFRNWLFRRMDQLSDTPEGRLLAMFDALEEWFAEREFRGCMFIKASAEYPEKEHPIHAQSSEHKRLIFKHLHRVCIDTGATDPEALARQLMTLKEGTIVMAVLGHKSEAAQDAKRAAKQLIDAAMDK